MIKRSTAARWLASVLALFALAGSVLAQTGRDYIYIVGSSSVYPFATVVAERFGRRTDFRTPKVESTGSGGGLNLFCDGVGVDYPDITNASRAIKPSEMEACLRNGVVDVVEVKIGYDGIVVANSVEGPDFALSRRDIYLALAQEVPIGADGELIENPYRTWSEVNAELPDIEIEVLGPPPTSGTRDTLVEVAMEAGCRTVPWIAALEESDVNRFRAICHTIREDGVFIEAGENDNLIVQKLEAHSSSLGIFGFSFLDQNLDTVKGAVIEGVAPTFEAIAAYEYPVSRPLYLYVKKAHVGVIPGMHEFLLEFTNERAWGEDGYLSYRGLIPLGDEERAEVASNVRNLTTLTFARE